MFFVAWCLMQVSGGLAFTTALRGPDVDETRPPKPMSYVLVSDLTVSGSKVSFGVHVPHLRPAAVV